MTEPSSKARGLALFLEANFGRTTAIQEGRCVPAPVGCGGPAGPFRDDASAREYRISGLCQECQDAFFGDGEEAA